MINELPHKLVNDLRLSVKALEVLKLQARTQSSMIHQTLGKTIKVFGRK